MFKLFSSLFSCNIAIDLGTTSILVHIQGKGVILDEPSIVALVVDEGVLKRKF